MILAAMLFSGHPYTHYSKSVIQACNAYIFLTPLYFTSQLGMQPIHYAAANGRAELLILLIDKFGVDPHEKADV